MAPDVQLPEADHRTWTVQHWHVDLGLVTRTVAALPPPTLVKSRLCCSRTFDAERGARERLHTVANDST